MRNFVLAAATILLAVPAAAQAPTPPSSPPAAPPPAAAPAEPSATPPPALDPHAQALQQALRNYPSFIVGANVHRADNVPPPPSCPKAGSRVEQKGGPTMEYLGASPDDPDLCVMKIGGQTLEAWYGIWGKTWPGGDYAHRGIARIMGARTGDVVGWDTTPAPEAQWHDLIRQEGIEDIPLLGRTYHAMKLSHYREGFNGNTYRSVSTVWKDMDTGMLIYGTYQHISGAPELDDPLIPTAIVPAP